MLQDADAGRPIELDALAGRGARDGPAPGRGHAQARRPDGPGAAVSAAAGCTRWLEPEALIPTGSARRAGVAASDRSTPRHSAKRLRAISGARARGLRVCRQVTITVRLAGSTKMPARKRPAAQRRRPAQPASARSTARSPSGWRWRGTTGPVAGLQLRPATTSRSNTTAPVSGRRPSCASTIARRSQPRPVPTRSTWPSSTPSASVSNRRGASAPMAKATGEVRGRPTAPARWQRAAPRPSAPAPRPRSGRLAAWRRLAIAGRHRDARTTPTCIEVAPEARVVILSAVTLEVHARSPHARQVAQRGLP